MASDVVLSQRVGSRAVQKANGHPIQSMRVPMQVSRAASIVVATRRTAHAWCLLACLCVRACAHAHTRAHTYVLTVTRTNHIACGIDENV